MYICNSLSHLSLASGRSFSKVEHIFYALKILKNCNFPLILLIKNNFIKKIGQVLQEEKKSKKKKKKNKKKLYFKLNNSRASVSGASLSCHMITTGSGNLVDWLGHDVSLSCPIYIPKCKKATMLLLSRMKLSSKLTVKVKRKDIVL